MGVAEHRLQGKNRDLERGTLLYYTANEKLEVAMSDLFRIRSDLVV